MADEAPKPYEVCVKGSEKAIGYACSRCYLFSSPTLFTGKWEERLKAAQQFALECCDKRCEKCGKSRDKRHYIYCSDCRPIVEAQREREKFEKAHKIAYEAYTGSWLYVENVGHNEGYFEDLDTLIDYYASEEIPPPAYAWTCDKIEFRLSAEDILEHALQDHHEDAGDHITTLDGNRLQKYLDVWARKQNIHSYSASNRVAVLLPDSLIQEYSQTEPAPDPIGHPAVFDLLQEGLEDVEEPPRRGPE